MPGAAVHAVGAGRGRGRRAALLILGQGRDHLCLVPRALSHCPSRSNGASGR